MTGARTRAVVVLALVASLVALLLVVRGGGDSYELRLQFTNAGRLVKGGEVQIAGLKVGSITDVDLADNGRAEVLVELDDDAETPLHRGTRAAIRQVGAATIANNFVDLRPGPTDGPELPDGATLAPPQTVGIVDLDAVLSSLTPAVRGDIRRLIANSSKVFSGSGAASFNGMLEQLNPALREIDAVSRELTSDRAQLTRLISTANRSATAIASRSGELQSSVGHVARALGAVASERSALAGIFDRAPGVMRQARGTLTDLSTAVTALRPTLRAVPPAAPPLGSLLSRLTTTARAATPVAGQLRRQLPDLRRSLAGFPPLRPSAVRGLDASGRAFDAANPMLEGLRLYGADFVLGIFNGLMAIASGNYNKAGHYIHVSFAQNPLLLPGGTLGSLLPDLSGLSKLSPALFSLKKHQTARCPGGASPPAPDGSSPRHDLPRWMCDPSQSFSEAINRP